MNCDECLHNIVCELWRKEERQDASTITDPVGDYGCKCFEARKGLTGIWKIRGDCEALATMYDCPVCDKITFIAVSNDEPAFCPHCGAKMYSWLNID